VRVFAGHDVGHQVSLGIVERQNLSWQGWRLDSSMNLQATFGRGEVVAVDDLAANARNQGFSFAKELDEGSQLTGAGRNERSGDSRLDVVELVVDGGDGNRDWGGPLALRIGGADRTSATADHVREQVDDGGEEQLTGVLKRGVLLEQLIDEAIRKSTLEKDSGEKGERRLRQELLRNVVKHHDGLREAANVRIDSAMRTNRIECSPTETVSVSISYRMLRISP